MSDGTGWTPPAEPGATPGWDAPAGPPPPPGYGGQYGGQYGAPPAWGQQNSPWGAPPASKPGVIALRPLGVGEILDGAFTVIRHYPKVTLGLSAVVMSITSLIQVALFLPSFLGDSATIDEFGGIGGSFATSFVIPILLGAVADVILGGMLTSVMGEAVLGRPATIGATWTRVRPRMWALFGASIIAGIVPVLGLLLLIPGIFLWGAWALVTPALILERIGVREALRRSWRLAVPDWWRVWGTRALAFLVAVVLGAIIQFPGGLLAGLVAGDGDGDILALVVVFLAQIVAGTITSPFTAGVIALLYIDRRMRAEGLDVTLAQAAAAEAGRL